MHIAFCYRFITSWLMERMVDWNIAGGKWRRWPIALQDVFGLQKKIDGAKANMV